MTRARTAKAAKVAKPLRADAARNRARVLEVALEAFAAEGLSVPIDEIARRVGVGVGTLYRHFPTKEALFAAIVLDRMARLVAEARGRANAEDPGAAFFEFLELFVEEAAAKRDLHDAIKDGGFEMPASLRRDMRDAIGTLLERARAAGAVRADVGVDEVIALVKGTFMAIAGIRGAGAASRRRVLAIVCDGLRARAGRAPTRKEGR
ncbi:MAG TPA: helix-turn-helix domain-containing protein [Minicystis sp.]|nr:helix-turn-helix domain-containing protein [Minicystis sp.]